MTVNGAGGETIAIEAGLADQLVKKFGRHSVALEDVRSKVRDAVEPLEAGAGQFADLLQNAGTVLAATWEEAAQRAADSAGVIRDTSFAVEIGLADIERRAAGD